MADFLSTLGSFFNAPQPEYITGLLGEDAANKLKQQAATTGLINMGVGYLAQPKNQRYGSALPYLARSYVAGQQSANAVYDNATQNYLKNQQMAEAQRKIDQQKQLQSEIEKIQDPQEKLYAKLAPEQWVANKAKAMKPAGKILQPAEIDQLRASGYNIPAGAVVQLDENGKLSLAEGTFQKEGTFKVGQTRDFNVGNEKITQEYQKNGTWKEIGRGSAFAPPNNFTVNMPSESERTAGFLTSRLKNALEQINKVVSKDPNAASPKIGAEAVQFLTGSDYLKNLTNPETRQQIESAQLELLDSALTLGTGAAYTREQLENYRKSYFPQLGDKPQNVKDKQDRLKSLLNAAKIKAGRAAPEDVGLPANVTVERVR